VQLSIGTYVNTPAARRLARHRRPAARLICSSAAPRLIPEKPVPLPAWRGIFNKDARREASVDSERSETTKEEVRYLPYPDAIAILRKNLNATPAELAAWIFMGYMGLKTGGIAAYLNAGEIPEPPRFRFPTGEWSGPGEDHDYFEPMMACWFRADEIENFVPTVRYMLGRDLLARWSQLPSPAAYIRAKVREFRLVEPVNGDVREPRLVDLHPVYGGTLASYPEEKGYPPIDLGLFLVSDIQRIETEDRVPVATSESNLGPQPMATGTARLTSRAGGARADLLAPVIADAVAQVGDDTARVFALLREWAKEGRPPLLGVTEDGLQWIDAHDGPCSLSQKMLGDRLRRRREVR
jgi:hypothetical protein